MSRDGSNGNTSRELSEWGRNSLAWWFQLDTWEPKEAICLMCGIDPRKTKIDWDEVTIELLDHVGTVIRKLERETFLYEDWQSCQTARSKTSDYDHEGISDEFLAIAEYQMDIEDSLKNVWMRFSRAVDFETDKNAASSPESYLNWAKSNGIDIPWLEWAVSRDLVKLKKTESPKARAKKEPGSNEIDQVSELREAAVRMAITRRVNDGMPKKHITVTKICAWLLESGKFSTGEPFTNRWREAEGIRSLLKGKNNPLSDSRYLAAKPIKSPNFNS